MLVSETGLQIIFKMWNAPKHSDNRYTANVVKIFSAYSTKIF